MLAFFYGALHDLHSTPTFCKTLLSLPGARPVYELNVYQVALAPTHILSIPPIKLPCSFLTLTPRHLPFVSPENSFGENFAAQGRVATPAQTIQVLTL